jgi:AcrR family transcriptional regulator
MRALVDAALSLFAEEGYGPVTTRRIAEAAGCSETLLFRYFGGKRGLLEAISNGLTDDVLDSSPLPSTTDYYDVQKYLEDYLLSGFEGVRRRSQALRVVFSALINEPGIASDFDRIHAEAIEGVARELRRFQEAGAISTQFDPVAIATGVEQMRFAVGYMLQVIYGRSEEELTNFARQISRVLTAGLQGTTETAPTSESLHRETLDAAVAATTGLGELIGALRNWGPGVPAPGPAPGKGVRSAPRRHK